MSIDQKNTIPWPSRPALETELDQAIAKGESLSVAIMDIDNFMAINDRYGHDSGDRVLLTLASIFAKVAPEKWFRITGDSFAILLPNTTLEQAFLLMEQLRGKVEESVEQFDLPNNHKVTITVGVAELARDASDREGLLQTADAACLAAKEMGRNRVGLPAKEEMVMKSCYYPSTIVRRLKALAEKLNRKESQLLREGLEDLLRKYDTI